VSLHVALAWGLSCFAVGWLLARWAYRVPAARRAQVETSPIDLRATLDVEPRSMQELIKECSGDPFRAGFEAARHKTPFRGP